MQNIIGVGSFVVAIFLCLLMAELLVIGLMKEVRFLQNSFDSGISEPLSFRMFKKNKFLWMSIYTVLWILAGVLVGLLLTDILTTMEIVYAIGLLFYFISDLRKSHPLTHAEPIITRVKRTEKWKDNRLFISLASDQNYRLLEILNSPITMRRLERLAQHAARTITFNPKSMTHITAADKLEQRLQEHFKLLMSEDSDSPNCILEEIYVILFMLSEECNLGKVVRNLISSDSIEMFFT